MTTLPTLKARLEEATGPLDYYTANGLANELTTAILGHECPEAQPSHQDEQRSEWLKTQILICYALRGGIKAVGAALELVERKMPGRTYKCFQHYTDGWYVRISPHSADEGWIAEQCDSLPLAILIALVSALIAEDEPNA